SVRPLYRPAPSSVPDAIWHVSCGPGSDWCGVYSGRSHFPYGTVECCVHITCDAGEGARAMSSPFDPISPQGRDIANLFIAVLIGGGSVFAPVTFLVIYAAIRFRHRAGDDAEPPQGFGRPRLEIFWTATPILLLAVIFGFTVGTMRAVSPGADGQQP